MRLFKSYKNFNILCVNLVNYLISISGTITSVCGSAITIETLDGDNFYY